MSQEQRTPGGGRGLRGQLVSFAVDTTPLRESRDLTLLLGGQAINIIGSQVRVITVPYLVYQQTHSSLDVGLLSLAQFVPALLGSLVGGNLADVMDRRRLLIMTQATLLLFSATLASAALLHMTPIWFLIIIVMMATAAIGSIDAPSRRAAITRLVRREKLASGLALNQVVMQTGGVVGPTLGGFAIALVGTGGALLIDTATFGAALTTLLLMNPMPSSGGALKGNFFGSFFSQTAEGLSFLKGRPVVLSTFLIDINATLFGAPTALFPALAANVFKTGAVGYALLYAAPSAGATAGALCSGWVSSIKHHGRAVIFFVAVWGIAIACFGLLAHVFWLALIMLAIAYMADQYSAIFRSTILQLAVPDNLRGRLSAIHFLVVGSGPRFGNFESGAVASATSTEFAVVSGGVLAFAGAIAVAFAIPEIGRASCRERV